METHASSTDLARLGQRLERLMGARVGVACSAIGDSLDQLYAEERACVERAVPKRQREFATGRLNARRAMASIGEAAVAIPSGADRAPVWPSHLCGSISHTDHACLALVARRSHIRSLGIDMETDRDMDDNLWPTICTAGELEHLASIPMGDRGRWVTRYFSAKEAVYKWQYPLTGRMLDFQQVKLRWLNESHEVRFVATLDLSPALSVPMGHCLLDTGVVVSWVGTT